MEPVNTDIPMQRSLIRQERRNFSMTGEEPKTEIWRLQWSWRSGNSSSSEVRLYETREKMERELFWRLMEADAEARVGDDSSRKRGWLTMLFERRKEQGDPRDEEERRHTTRIISVERWNGEEWVPYRFGVSAPALRLEVQQDEARQVVA